MSDEAVGTATATDESTSSSTDSATPQTTADVAASVIAEFENADADPADEATDTKPAAGDADKAEAQSAADADDFETQPAEVTDALGRKRENRLPHSRVKTMMSKAEQKVLKAVASELGITVDEAQGIQLADVMGHIGESKKTRQSIDDKLKNVDAVEAMMAGDGDRFIRVLAEVNPEAYGKFAALLDPGASATTTAPAVTAPADDPEPEPDYPLQDAQGNEVGRTFSLDGLKKLRGWEGRRGTKELRGKTDKRFNPLEHERAQARQAEEHRRRGETLLQQAKDRVSQQMDGAQKWTGFSENADGILAG